MTVSPEGFQLEFALPIIISAVALLISGISLGWNIDRDVALKPKAKISISKRKIFDGNKSIGPFLNISAANHGPGSFQLDMTQVRRTSWWRRVFRKEEYGSALHLTDNVLFGQLPRKLEAGEKVDLFYPWKENLFLQTKPTHIGVSEPFGRMNWTPRRYFNQTLKQWEEDFRGEIRNQG